MATYTIIKTTTLRNRSDIIIEFDVPAAGVNNAGVQWRNVFAEIRAYEERAGTSVNPRKQGLQAHINRLDNGTIVELSLSVSYNANLPDADKELFIDAAAAAEVANYETEFQNIYEFYGTERTV